MMSLAEQCVLEVICGGKARVRNLHVDDVIPERFKIGFDLLGKLDHPWVWVVERHGEIEGVLVASPCHGMAMIYRLMCDGPVSSLTKLLRGFLRDIRQLGFVGYMTFLDPERKVERKLMKVIKRAGGQQVGELHAIMASVLPREGI